MLSYAVRKTNADANTVHDMNGGMRATFLIALLLSAGVLAVFGVGLMILAFWRGKGLLNPVELSAFACGLLFILGSYGVGRLGVRIARPREVQ